MGHADPNPWAKVSNRTDLRGLVKRERDLQQKKKDLQLGDAVCRTAKKSGEPPASNPAPKLGLGWPKSPTLMEKGTAGLLGR